MINRETRQGYAMHSGKGVNEQGHGPNGPSLKVSSTHDEMLDSTLRLYNRFPPSEALAQQPDHGIEHHSTRPSLLHVLQKGTGAWYCSSLSTTCDLHTMDQSLSQCNMISIGVDGHKELGIVCSPMVR